MLTRTGINNKDFTNPIEIIEGTFNFYKIEIRSMLAPVKIFINYINNLDNKVQGDLKVFYSTKINKPDEKNCES